jgi:Ca2+-binding EF-hand superfamily protein
MPKRTRSRDQRKPQLKSESVWVGVPIDVRKHIEDVINDRVTALKEISEISRVFTGKLNLSIGNNSLNELEAILSSEMDKEEKIRRVQHFAADVYKLQEKAQKVFSILDEAKKGCIVAQDLQRASNELGDQKLTEEEIGEMIEFVTGDPDGILTFDHLLDVAKQVNL